MSVIKFNEYAKNRDDIKPCPRCETDNQGLYRAADAPEDSPYVCAACYRKELYGDEEGTD